MKKRMIALDADYLLFACTEGKYTKTCGFSKKKGSKVKSEKEYKEPLKPYKDKLKAMMKDVENEISANMVGEIKGIKPIFSDPKDNFRYALAKDYKAGRPPRSKLWYRLHKWALKKYGYTKGIEADDEVAYLVLKKGWVGASMDKDLWRGIEGDWFNVYHSNRTLTYTSPKQARDFNLIQTLTGDGADNIKGIAGVGEVTAIKLLDKYGWNWNGVVQAYENHIQCMYCGKMEKWDTTKIENFEHDGDLIGTCPKCKKITTWYQYKEEDALLARRLICLRQWTPKKGVRLWSPDNE